MIFLNLLKSISEWTDEAPWRSWLAHGLLALPISWALSWGTLVYLWVIYDRFLYQASVITGVVATVSFYLLRELEQMAHRKMNGQPLAWLDHIMDVLSPLAALVLVSIVL